MIDLRKIFRAITVTFVFLVVYFTSGSLSATPITITKADDPRIEAMLAGIDGQNFAESDTTAEEVKALMRHFVFTSNFKAVGGGKFPYPNSASKNFTTIDDGTYKKTITGAKGCMAYARFVSRVVYGKEGEAKYKAAYTADEFKEMLQTYGQAGDHLRADGKHSLIFVSCDDAGFYTLDYINLKNQNMQLAYWGYAEFLDFKLYKGRKLFLYDANPSVNIVEGVENPEHVENADNVESF